MIEQRQFDRSMVVTIDMNECPWLRNTNVQLPGYVHKDYVQVLGSVRKCNVDVGISIQCYESVTDKYVIQLHWAQRVDAQDKARSIAALQSWISDLYIPKSCAVNLNQSEPIDGYW